MVVSISDGQMEGIQENGLHIFKGIPYARPPVKELRFKAPKPVIPWEGIRDAKKFGGIAPQAILPEWPIAEEQSEDCLYLNIWTPACDDHKRPVVVWIHGGAFVMGAGSEYDCAVFAEKGIVSVTINYRLGALGFLELGDVLGDEYRGSGNCGLMDIIAALRWVQQYISSFGGDPARVTVMGQSAGAKLASTLLCVPEAKGLFHRAIIQSGGVQSIRDLGTASTITGRFLEALNLSKEQGNMLLELPFSELIKAQSSFDGGATGLHKFGPVIDGKTIVRPPLESIRMGEANVVPVLIGSNKDEALATIQIEGLSIMEKSNVQALFGKNGLEVTQAYEEACLQKTREQAAVETLTNYLYGYAVVQLAEALAAKHVPVWLYRFDYSKGAMGAVHSAEMPLIWKLPMSPLESERLVDRMHQAWVSFMSFANPEADDVHWSKFDLVERKAMVFDDECQLISSQPIKDVPSQVFIL
ncbi:carboxylesterase/lipase family protein [Paenibacillus hexagrammi]|uniref:Carboxylic ester hydrolase n=1 Tax=Paenibacillus hexagrammi TaxID=2908839 RepID=A0ABY3SEW2_9BACL|nr:carboxylesterase/lipase family protein [Paenibacillus sp. YPD9-1]UJF31779.1 carboxylesterase/lipase family protein [Paenibacillus sp. YPD9-1]